MKRYIKTQCRNMITTIAVFEQACELAAKQETGRYPKRKQRRFAVFAQPQRPSNKN